MKFLINLNDGYDMVRGQLLLMDPLPTVIKAYSYIQQVERHKLITDSMHFNSEAAANMANNNNICGKMHFS